MVVERKVNCVTYPMKNCAHSHTVIARSQGGSSVGTTRQSRSSRRG